MEGLSGQSSDISPNNALSLQLQELFTGMSSSVTDLGNYSNLLGNNSHNLRKGRVNVILKYGARWLLHFAAGPVLMNGVYKLGV